MNIRVQLALLGAAMLLGCSTGAVAAEGRHWSYGGHEGPAEWGAISPEFVACKQGKHQSPIDIRGATPAGLPAIAFDYKPSDLHVVDNGHTIQVNYAPGSSIDVAGTRYELVQFHFHKPSEEKIDGVAHAMVAHLVHRDAGGKLAVVAVLLDNGGASPVIDAVWNAVPKRKNVEGAPAGVRIDAASLLPPDRSYYTFDGSLTTPPCSEGVTWFVLKTPVRIADREITAFGKLYPMNARPTQALNGRSIRASQ